MIHEMPFSKILDVVSLLVNELTQLISFNPVLKRKLNKNLNKHFIYFKEEGNKQLDKIAIFKTISNKNICILNI